MTSAIVDTLFPPTPDYLGYALFFGVVIDMFKPIPWLRVIAGLTAMSFEGRYSRSGDEIRIVVCFKTHATEQYDRDGKLIQDSEPPKTGLHLHRLYSAKDLAECADPRVPIMNQIRQVAEHEILESLQVIDGSGSRQPFWRRELDGLHGDTNAKAELIESRLPADAIMVARQESKAKVLAHGESPFHQKPITYPSLPSKADRAERLLDPEEPRAQYKIAKRLADYFEVVRIAKLPLETDEHGDPIDPGSCSLEQATEAVSSARLWEGRRTAAAEFVQWVRGSTLAREVAHW